MKTVNTISAYIEMNKMRSMTPALLKDGLFTFYVNGEWISENDFNRQFPLVEFKRYNEKGVNPHRKYNYLNNNKSY